MPVSLVGPLMCSPRDKGVGRGMHVNTFRYTLIGMHNKCIYVYIYVAMYVYTLLYVCIHARIAQEQLQHLRFTQYIQEERMGSFCDKYFHYVPVIACAFRDLSIKNKKGPFRFNGQAQSTDDRNVFALVYVKAMTDSGKGLC